MTRGRIQATFLTLLTLSASASLSLAATPAAREVIAARARAASEGEPRHSTEADPVSPCPEGGTVVAGSPPPAGHEQWCELRRPDGLYERHGVTILWDTSREPPVINPRGNWAPNVRDGALLYYEHGQLMEEKHFVAGQEVRPHRKWSHPEGLKRVLVLEYLDRDDGGTVLRKWTDTGVQTDEFEKDRNKKMIREMSWYETGTPRREETRTAMGGSLKWWWPKGQLQSERQTMAAGGATPTRKYGPGGELLEISLGPYGSEKFAVYDDPAPPNALTRPDLTEVTQEPLAASACPPGTELSIDSNRRDPVSGCYRPGHVRHGPEKVVRSSGVTISSYKDGQLDGRVTTWERSDDGFAIAVDSYSENELDGRSARWYANGARREAGSYRRGKKHGLWMSYDANGRRTKQESYLDGEKHGEWLEFDYDASVEARHTYSNGKRDGVFATWDEFGRPTREESYRDDKLNGRQREWKDGVLMRDTYFADGVRSGSEILYTRSGAIFQSAHWENGERTGEWRQHRRDGSLAEAGSWEHNKRVGHWRFLHANGVVLTEGDYALCDDPHPFGTIIKSANRRDPVAESSCRIGVWTYRAEDGSELGTVDEDANTRKREQVRKEAAIRAANPVPPSPPRPIPPYVPPWQRSSY